MRNDELPPSIWCDTKIPDHLKDHFYKTFSKELVDRTKCCRKAKECKGNHRMDGIYMITEPPSEESYSYHLSWYLHWEDDKE